MMRNYYTEKFKGFLILNGGLFLVFGLTRSLFMFYNSVNFSSLSIWNYFLTITYGIRFDWFSISALNSIFILLYILPVSFQINTMYRFVSKTLFLVSNGTGFFFELVDIAYFDFSNRRSTVGIFNLIFKGQSDILNLMPHFITRYWFLIVLFIVILIYLNWLYNKIDMTEIPNSQISIRFIARQSLFVVTISTLVLLGIRGGVQKVPIVLLDASKKGFTQFNQAILNTSFCILKSMEMEQLKPYKYFSESEVIKLFNPTKIAERDSFKSYNVCIIILESFSKEFTALGGRKSYTPFLDSLMNESLVFPNAFANGKTSIEALPSILSSIPSFMQRPYINSAYSNNSIDALPNLLKEKGYSTQFFHGGTNGTMNFNSFASIAGFNKYFGRQEYNNDVDYDGTWGIWDHKFFPKVVDEMDKCKEPFFTSLFTLSSHDPFKVPEEFKGRFPTGNLSIEEVIGYTDFSLRNFFVKAMSKEWFKKTIFILTADHTSISNDKYYSSIVGQYSIPIMIYNYEGKKGISKKVVQQIDIQPTVLDMLNYDLPSYAFGKSMLKKDFNPVIFFPSPSYYVVEDSTINIFDGHKLIETYNFVLDSQCHKNVDLKIAAKTKLENYTKAFLQTYSSDVSENKTTAKAKTNEN